jgi:hypothetical protein
MDNSYYKKYLKYRNKYLNLKNQIGGTICSKCGNDMENCICKQISELPDRLSKLISNIMEKGSSPNVINKALSSESLLNLFEYLMTSAVNLSNTEDIMKLHIIMKHTSSQKATHIVDILDYVSKINKVLQPWELGSPSKILEKKKDIEYLDLGSHDDTMRFLMETVKMDETQLQQMLRVINKATEMKIKIKGLYDIAKLMKYGLNDDQIIQIIQIINSYYIKKEIIYDSDIDFLVKRIKGEEK